MDFFPVDLGPRESGRTHLPGTRSRHDRFLHGKGIGAWSGPL